MTIFTKCDICKEYRDCFVKKGFVKDSRPQKYFSNFIKYICKKCLRELDKKHIEIIINKSDKL